MYLEFGDHLFWNISGDSVTHGKLLFRVGNYNKEKGFLPIKTGKEGSQETKQNHSQIVWNTRPIDFVAVNMQSQNLIRCKQSALCACVCALLILSIISQRQQSPTVRGPTNSVHHGHVGQAQSMAAKDLNIALLSSSPDLTSPSAFTLGFSFVIVQTGA